MPPPRVGLAGRECDPLATSAAVFVSDRRSLLDLTRGVGSVEPEDASDPAARDFV
jgi:hypothetical protein